MTISMNKVQWEHIQEKKKLEENFYEIKTEKFS